MAPPSLVSLCTKVAIQHVDSLYDVGSFEYWKIEPVLKHVKNAEQLREIEVNSPQIQGVDFQLWKNFIFTADARWREKNYVPRNPTKWYHVYRRYKREAEAKLKQDEENLRNAMLGLHKEKASHTSQLVDARSLPKVPRDRGMRVTERKGQQQSRNESSLTWRLGSKTKMSDSKGVLLRAKREAKEISIRGKMVVPANQLKGRSIVKQAPQSMVEEYRRSANAPLKIFTLKSGPTPVPSSVYPDRETSERKLRALTLGQGKTQSQPRRATSDSDASSGDRRGSSTGTAVPKQTIVSDDEESDVDDLFDEKPSPPKKQAVRPAAQSQNSRPREVQPPKLQLNSNSRPGLHSGLNRRKSSDLSNPSMARARPAAGAGGSPAAKPSTPAKSSTPAQRSGGMAAAATAGGATGAGRPLVRKREVDVFNRTVKKTRH